MFRKRDRKPDERPVAERDGRNVDDEPGRKPRRGRTPALVRGVTTLIGAAGAGVLLWLATQVNDETTGGYWAVYGLIAAAGLALPLSQLLGGWTKWGWPRLSVPVFLIGFLPALVAGGWLLLGHQPDGNWFRTHVLNWSNDIGVNGVVEDLREYIAVVAFGLGVLFGFTFDTTGPRVREAAVAEPRRRRAPEPVPAEDRVAADEPVTAERREVPATSDERAEAKEPQPGDRSRRFFSRRPRGEREADTAVAERPPTTPTEE